MELIFNFRSKNCRLFLITIICNFCFTPLSDVLAQVQNQEAFVYQCVPRVPGVCIQDLSTGEVRVWRDNVFPGPVAPNGKRIAYIHQASLLTGDLNFENRNRPGIDDVSYANHTYVATWTPIGDRIAIIYRPDASLKIFRPDGTLLQEIPDLQTPYLSWSPDGSKIAYEITIPITATNCPEERFGNCARESSLTAKTIAVLDLASGERSTLYTPKANFTTINDGRSIVRVREMVEVPVWSPIDNRIAVRRTIIRTVYGAPQSFSYEGRNVGLISASGSNEVQLVTTDHHPLPAAFSQENITRNTPMAWSPDGSQLAYVKVGEHTLRGHPVENVPREIMGIYVTSLNGPGERVSDVITEHLQWVILNQSGIQLDIITSPDRIKIGTKINALVRVTSYEEDPQTISFLDPLLEETETDEEKQLLGVDVDELPEPFVLTPENPTQTFYVPIIALKAGVTELKAAITVTDEPGGGEELIETLEKIAISPFEIEISSTPHELVLNQSEDAEKTADCIELENSPDISNCLELTITVKNISNQRVDGVTLQSEKDALKWITSRDQESPGVPLTQLRYSPPAGTELEPLAVDLESGGTATFKWNLNAFEAPANLEVEALVIGSIDGHQVRGYQEEDLNILDKVLLKWGISKTNNTRTEFLSGQAVRVEGFIQNVTMESAGGEEGEGKDLLVLVYPKSKGNLGGGFMDDASIGETAEEYQFFVLPPEGDGSRLDIVGTFRSLPTVGHTTGEVEYGVRVWVIQDDDSLTDADSQVKLEDKGDWVSGYQVRFAANDPTPDSYRQDCIEDGHWIWVCGFSDGFVNDFAPAMYGLYQYADDLGGRMFAHKVFLMKTAFQAMMGDLEALELFFGTIYDDYVKRVELGVMGIKGAPMAFEQFALAGVGAISKFLKAVDDGDMEEVQFQIGHFLGANPDMLLEPFIMGKSFLKLWKQLRKTANDVGENVANRVLRQKAMRQEVSLSDRLAAGRADPNVTDLSTVLKAGDGLSDDLLREIYGLSTRLKKNIQTICEEMDCIVAFRSRDPRARALIENKKAYPKPQVLKFKCVNDIDINYLGYPKSSAAKVQVIEPPPGLAGKVDGELEAALDAYMDRLKGLNSDLQTNSVLAKEVRTRLKTRAKEWNKLAPQLDLDSSQITRTKVETNFGYGEQTVKRDMSYEVGVNESREVIQKPVGTVKDPVAPDSNRRVWDIEMSGPDGELPVAGDVDFLGIFDKNGRIIKDDEKRKAIYEQLAQFVDMQHGESYTFRMQKVREEYLRCCVEGGEAMVTIGPGRHRTPTAGYFVDNLSVLKGGPNQKFLRPRTKETILDGKGRVVYDEKGNPKTIEIRRENPQGEFVLINGSAPLSNVALDFVRAYSPFIWDDLISDFIKRIPYYFPAFLGREILFEITEKAGGGAGPVDEKVEFRLDGPVAQAGRVENGESIRDSSRIRVWTEAAGWENSTPEEVIAMGKPAMADLAPMTSCPNGAEIGENQIHITTQEELETSGDFFSVGDRVVLNPGFENEEYLVISEIPQPDELVFSQSFQLKHVAGEMLVCLGPASINDGPQFLRGDCNVDGSVDIADAVTNLTYQFIGTFTPTCFDACDFDDSSFLDVSDPIASLSYQFLGTAPPAAPGFETCGVDPTEDNLTCESFGLCLNP